MVWDKHQADNLRLLKTTIDSSLDMIQVFEAVRNDEGTIIDFKWVLNNEASARIYGDVIGKSLLQLQPGVVDEGIFDAFKGVVETGLPQHYEKHYVHEQFDGWFYQSVVKLGDGVATTTSNITERKKAEEQLQTAKERLQATLDGSLYFVQAFESVRNEAGKIIDFKWVFTNHTWNKHYGDVIGKSLLTQNPGVIETGLFDKFVQVTETGITIDQEQHYSHEQFHEQWFHQTLVKMGDGFVMNTEDITSRKKAEAEILRLKDEIAQRATDKYHALFDTIEEGLTICGVVRDDEGKVVDLRYLELNRALEQQTGLDRNTMIGRLLSEVLPKADAERWRARYIDAANSGKPLTFEEYTELLHRWYAVSVYPRGEELSIFYRDITERKRHERQQRFLLNLSDALRPIVDPVAIQETASGMTAEHLDIGRVTYCEISYEPDIVVIVERDWARRGMPSVAAGRYRMDDFGSFLAKELTAGRPAIVVDATTDPRLSQAERENWNQFEIVANCALPVIKEGRFVAYLVAQDNRRHDWTDREIDLLREVSERTWAAVERAKSEESLRTTERRLRAVLQQAPLAIAVTGVTGEILFHNTVFDQLWGRPAHDTSAKTYSDVYGGYHLDGRPIASEEWPGARAVLQGEVIQGEVLELVHQSGRRIRCSFNAAPIRDAAGNITGAVVLFRDISNEWAAQEALRKSEEKFRTVFETIDEGFALMELVRNERGKVTDLIYRQVNDTFKRFTGWPDAVDKKGSELMPNLEQSVLDIMQSVADTGETYRREDYIADLHRWYDVHYTCIGKPGSNCIVAVFEDITERKQRELHQDFLLQFSDTLRTLTGKDTIENVSLQLLSEFLSIDRSYITTSNKEEDRAVIRAEYNKSGLASILGEYRMSDFPEGIRQIEAQTLIIENIATDPTLSHVDKVSLAAINLAALVAASVREGERNVVWSFVAANSTPRKWTKEEVELIETVSERTWAAAERATAEERLQKTISIQTVGVLFFNLDGSITECNDAFEQMIGYTIEELRAVDWKVMTPEEFTDVTTIAATELAEKGETAPYEKELIRKDGSRFWALCAPRRLEGEGKEAQCVEFIIDISERKKAQAALQQAQEAYRIQLEQEVRDRTIELLANRDELEREQHFLEQVTDKAPLLIYVYDLNEERFTYINKRVEELIGKSEEYIYAMGPHLFQAILHPEDLSRYTAYMKGLKNLSGGQVTENDFRVWNGTQFRWFRSRDSVFREGKKHVQQVIGIAEDVTYEKMLEEKLQSKGPIGLN